MKRALGNVLSRALDHPLPQVFLKVCLLTGVTLDLGSEQLRGDRIEPCGERSFGVELTDMVIGMDQRLMGDFIHHGGNRQTESDEGSKPPAVDVHQLLERIDIPLLDPMNKGRFVRGHHLRGVTCWGHVANE